MPGILKQLQYIIRLTNYNKHNMIIKKTLMLDQHQ